MEGEKGVFLALNEFTMVIGEPVVLRLSMALFKCLRT